MDEGANRGRRTWPLFVAMVLWLAACLLPVAGCAQQSNEGGATGAYALVTGWEVTRAWPAWVGQFLVFGLGIAAVRRGATPRRDARRRSVAALLVAVLAIADAALFLTSGMFDCGDGGGQHLSLGFFLWALALLSAASSGMVSIRSSDDIE